MYPVVLLIMIAASLVIYYVSMNAASKLDGVKRKALFIGGWFLGLLLVLAFSSVLNLSVKGSNDASMVYIVCTIMIYVLKNRKYKMVKDY